MSNENGHQAPTKLEDTPDPTTDPTPGKESFEGIIVRCEGTKIQVQTVGRSELEAPMLLRLAANVIERKYGIRD